MSSWNNVRRRYCFVETKNEIEHYYAVVEGQPVEVTKEQYDVIEPSYRLEWEMQYGKKAKKTRSIEQMMEQIELMDLHGHVPAALQTQSAEDEYLQSIEEEKTARKLSRMNDEIRQLPNEKQEMIRSYAKKDGYIERIAERDSVSKLAIYHRRERLGKTIARRVQEGETDE